jgi:Fe-Mn family superoxide dismutase
MYEAKKFENLLGTPGFSDTLLQNHFKLYQGYVANTNKVIELLTKATGLEYAELKRRFGWEFNGMRLHELYFENLSKNKNSSENTNITKKIVEDFGSFENWQKDFKSIAAMRGIGWVILYYDPTAKKLFNTWVNEHDTGHLSGAIPILIMDVFEHAFITDYGLKKADYMEAFFKAIDWDAVAKRFQ